MSTSITVHFWRDGHAAGPRTATAMLDQGSATIGSADDCTVRLAGPGVLPHHCRISRSDDGTLRLDVMPGAAVHVDGRRRDGGPLEPGELLEIGDMRAVIATAETADLATQVVARQTSRSDATIRVGPPIAPSPTAGQLARYPIVRTLGAGGMGQVLQVLDDTLGRDVAAKVILGEADDAARRRFELEARITGQLEHPNIVPVYELGHAGDELYFTMKRVEGQDLQDLLADRADDEASLRRELTPLLMTFLKLCDGVAFAHDRGVVHRDLKPANVMVGAFGEVLLMDWGLAKVAGGEEASPVRTTPLHDGTLDGDIKGTPDYMSPEQARGENASVGPASDIYALGVILYEILAGCRPFEARTLWELLAKVSDEAPPPPSERAPGRWIPRELEAVALRAMAREPADRYASVGELAADITRYLEGRALEAADYTLVQLLGKWVLRNRGLVAAAAAVLIAGLAVFVTLRRQAATERRAALDAALADVSTSLDGQPDVAALRAGSASGSPRQILGSYLAAVSALDRALWLSPDDAGLRARRLDLGEGLLRAALLRGNLTLAEVTLTDLGKRALPAKRLAALRGSIRDTRERTRRAQRRRLGEIVALLADDDPKRQVDGWTADDLVFEVAGFPADVCVAGVAEALEPLIAHAREGGDRATWTTAQQRVARFACRVLARVRDERAVGLLARFLEHVRDPTLTEEAALALCHTRSAAAYAPLTALERRLAGTSSQLTSQLRRLMRHVPHPEGLDMSNSGALVASADQFIRQGKLDQARRALQAIVKPEADTYHMWARLARAEGKDQEALAQLTRAIASDGTFIQAINDRGLLLLDLGKPREALADFDRALEIRVEASVLVNRALARIALGDYAAATADLTDAIARNDRLASAWNNRGIARERGGDLAGAIADYGRAIALDPGETEASLNRGMALLAAGRPEEAVRDFDRVLERSPGRHDVLQRRALAHVQRGNLEQAIVDLDRALKLEPKALYYNDRGQARWDKKDHDGALADFTSALERDPAFVPALGNRTQLLLAMGRQGPAAADARRWLAATPANANQYTIRGIFRAKQLKDIAGGLADLSAALRLQPASVRARVNRATLYARQNQLPEALADLREAIRLDPDAYRTHQLHGIVLFRAGRRAEAEAALRKAHALAPPERRPAIQRLIDQARQR